MARIIPTETFLDLKDALEEVRDKCGGVDPLASVMRCAKSSASEFYDKGHDRVPSVDKVLAAERFARAPLVTAAMARFHGYKLVPLSAEEASGLGQALAEVVQAASGSTVTICNAMADSVVTAAEALGIDRQLDLEARAVEQARRKLAAMRNTEDERPQLRAVGD